MKKNTKTVLLIVAVVIIVAVVFLSVSLSGKQTVESNSTKESEITTAESTSETTTEPQPSDKETLESQNVNTTESANTNILERRSEDDEALCCFLEHILWNHSFFEEYSGDKFDYDYQSENASIDALKYMIYAPYDPLMEALNRKYKYGWESYFDVCLSVYPDEIMPADPKAQFKQQDYYDYTKYDADFFDELMLGMFNVKTNRDLDYKVNYDGKQNMVFYYDSGYYYARYSDGGDAAGPVVHVSDFKANGDGTYSVAVDYDMSIPDEAPEDIATIQATVALKDIHGKRVWSLYEMHEIK